MKKSNNIKIVNLSNDVFSFIIKVLIISICMLVLFIFTAVYYTAQTRKVILQNNKTKESIATLDNEISEKKELAMEQIFNNSNKSNKYYIARDIDSKYAFIYEQGI